MTFEEVMVSQKTLIVLNEKTKSVAGVMYLGLQDSNQSEGDAIKIF